MKLDRIEDAQAVLDQAKSKGAKGDVLEKLAQRLQKASQMPPGANQIAAKSQLKQPNILDSLKLDQAIKLAKKKEKDGALEEAKRIYQDVLLKFPKNKKAKDGLKNIVSGSYGNTYIVQEAPQDQVQTLINLYNRGQLKHVLNDARKLSKRYPKSLVIWNLLGASAAQLGQLDDAIIAFQTLSLLNQTAQMPIITWEMLLKGKVSWRKQ